MRHIYGGPDQTTWIGSPTCFFALLFFAWYGSIVTTNYFYKHLWLNIEQICYYENTWAQLFKTYYVLVNDSLKFTSSDTQICWNFLLKKCE